jgi:hypothetical protein
MSDQEFATETSIQDLSTQEEERQNRTKIEKTIKLFAKVPKIENRRWKLPTSSTRRRLWKMWR